MPAMACFRSVTSSASVMSLTGQATVCSSIMAAPSACTTHSITHQLQSQALLASGRHVISTTKQPCICSTMKTLDPCISCSVTHLPI